MNRISRTMALGMALVLIGAARLVAASEADAKPDRERLVYYFEHRLLPKWTHNSGGAFYSDLLGGNSERLQKAAAEIVDEAFAQALVVRAMPERNQVLIAFQEPSRPPLCYFVLIQKHAESFRFITLEATEDLLGDGTQTAVCGWTEEGSHQNFGGRKYRDEKSFLAEHEEETGQSSKPVAEFTPGRAGDRE